MYMCPSPAESSTRLHDLQVHRLKYTRAKDKSKLNSSKVFAVFFFSPLPLFAQRRVKGANKTIDLARDSSLYSNASKSWLVCEKCEPWKNVISEYPRCIRTVLSIWLLIIHWRVSAGGTARRRLYETNYIYYRHTSLRCSSIILRY